MKDQFDIELSRALKSGMDKELQNLEFTAAMRRRVLERVREEEAEQAPPVQMTAPAPRNRFSAWTKSLGIVAAAAAAVTLMARVDWKGADNEYGVMSGASANLAGTAEVHQETGTNDSQNELARMAPPGDAELVPTVWLTMPEGALPPNKGGLPHENRAVEPLETAPGAVALKVGAVAMLNADGETEWEAAVEGVNEQSLLAVSPQGQVAVTTTLSVQLMDANGKYVQDIALRSQPAQVAFSPRGRLAVAQVEAVSLVAEDMDTTEIEAPSPKVAFATDGSLVVLSHNELRFYDESGRERWRKQVIQPMSDELTVSLDQQVVLAAGTAYNAGGDMLWAAPFAYEGAAAVRDGFIIWDGFHVWLLDFNGAVRFEVHLASPEPGVRQVVGKKDGSRLAVLGSTSAGNAVWVLDEYGLLLAEHPLSEEPLDAAFLNGKLLVITPTQMVTLPVE